MKKPTKQQIRVARRRMKKANALRREAWKVLRKIPRRRRYRIPLVDREFYTWAHDIEVLMKAVVRLPASDTWGPTEIAQRAVAVADQMKAITSSRFPANSGNRGRVMDWESTFDGFVHELADRSSLDANGVINRSVALTDAMTKELARRRRKK